MPNALEIPKELQNLSKIDLIYWGDSHFPKWQNTQETTDSNPEVM